MASIKYPDWLPLAQRASKNLTQQTPFRSDQPAVGAPIFQKLTTDIAATWSLTWKFTLAEERAFIQWLRSSRYLNKCNNWFTMMIDLGGSGLQEQTLHFTDYPVQTSIDGGVVTWTGNVIAKKLNNTMDEFDDVLVELDYRWYSWLDEVVNRDLPQVYMTPILHMPINMLSPTLDSRVIYEGPQVYYINRNGNLVQSVVNEWPLTFIDGVAVGRVPPEKAATNVVKHSNNLLSTSFSRARTTTTASSLKLFQETYAAKLTATLVSGNHYINQRVAPAPGTRYSISAIIKAEEYQSAAVAIGNPAALDNFQYAYVDLASGDLISGDTSRSFVSNIGGGWYHVSMAADTNDSGGLIYSQINMLSPSNSLTFMGDGVSGFNVALIQLEASPFASSPIVTELSPGTRTTASAKVVMNGATSIDITYSDGSVVNVPSVDGYATVPQADSAWGSKYITTIKFNV